MAQLASYLRSVQIEPPLGIARQDTKISNGARVRSMPPQRHVMTKCFRDCDININAAHDLLAADAVQQPIQHGFLH